MCGICGIISKNVEKKLDESELTKMLDMIRHRGPDDSGTHIEGNSGVGHCRLSIIDLSRNGQQPMCNEDGSIWITYNGEFYNFRDYIAELKRDGHQFRSNTDTEVIIHLYEKYGLENTLKKINGMFAFCIWDKRKGRHYLVRDRFGIKPLYYYIQKEDIYFSSEVKAFYATDKFEGKILSSKVPEYFAFARSLDNKTLLENVYEVKPGTYIEISPRGLQEAVYYNLPAVTQKVSISESEALEELDRLLEKAVKRRLVSDVPVGVFLSGGLDSSIIALKMRDILDGPINTISVGYSEESANEFYWSDQIAEKIHSKHHQFLVSSENFCSLYPWLINMHDAPLAPVGVGFYLAARVAKSKCTVMLSGQGSDEVFGGYTSYIYSRYQSIINKLLKYSISQAGTKRLSELLPKMASRKVFRKVAARAALDDALVAASYASGMIKDNCIDFLKNGSGVSYMKLLNKYADQFYPDKKLDFLTNMLLSEMNHGLQIRLQETDKMTMACAVEARVPFLDHQLVEFAFSLPSSLKVRGGEGKYLLKKYLAKRMSPDFVYRKKRGFPTPTYDWLKNSNHEIHNLLSCTNCAPMTDFFNMAHIWRFIALAQKGEFGKDNDTFAPVMSFLSLKLWWEGVEKALKN